MNEVSSAVAEIIDTITTTAAGLLENYDVSMNKCEVREMVQAKLTQSLELILDELNSEQAILNRINWDLLLESYDNSTAFKLTEDTH